jgi:hypothetical protein
MNSLKRALEAMRSVVPGQSEVKLCSSAIRSASYDRNRRSLRVQFNRGATYEFGSVEPWRFRQLVSAPSAGRYFVSEIRNRYPYRQVAGTDN